MNQSEIQSYFDQLTLNGKTYNREELKVLCNEKKNIESYEKDLFHCIESLVDKKDHIIVQTSGTTGSKSEMQLSKEEIILSALRTQNYFKLTPGQTAMLCLPTSFIAGKMMVVRAFVSKLNLISVHPSSNPFQNIHFSIDFCAMTPYQFYHAFDSMIGLRYKGKVILGGSPVTREVLKKVEKAPFEIFETFGMTETASHIAIKTLNGKHSNKFEVLEGFTLSTDDRGCLLIEQIHPERKIQTNDMVRLTGNTFTWLGRYDNLINSGGIKINPEHIESKLIDKIDIPFFIGSLPDEQLGQKVVLIFESKNPKISNLDTYRKIINERLTKYEKPQEFYRCEKFLKTISGKIMRNDIMRQCMLIRIPIFVNTKKEV